MKSEEYHIEVLTNGGSEPFECDSEQNILAAMQRAGLTVVPVGCRGGGCGVCRVEIVSGACEYGKMSRAHITELDEKARRFALACKLFPAANMEIRPVGKLFKKIQSN